MMTDNIIAMPTPLGALAQQLRDDVAATIAIHTQWVDSMLRLAAHLRDARGRFGADDRAFGVWLAQEEIGLSYNDRACLIKMGRDPKIFRNVLLEQTEALHANTLWLKYERIFQSDLKDADPTLDSSQTDPNSSVQPAASISASLQSDQEVDSLPPPKHELASGGTGTMKDPAKAELVKTLDIAPEEFAAVMGAYPRNRQNKLKAELSALANKKNDEKLPGMKHAPYYPGKKRAQSLFAIALDVVKTGKAPELTNTQAIDARVFLPDVPYPFLQRFTLFDLAKHLDCLGLLNSKAAELRDASASAFDTHNELMHIWENGTLKPAPVAKPVSVAVDDTKSRIKHEVKYCGIVIWPSERLKHVTYNDMNMGWHIADHWLKHLEVATPQKPNEVLVEVMHLIQDLRAASSLNAVTDVMMECVSAYAKRNQRREKADLSDNVPPGRPR
jgi:hypothetical protein